MQRTNWMVMTNALRRSVKWIANGICNNCPNWPIQPIDYDVAENTYYHMTWNTSLCLRNHS